MTWSYPKSHPWLYDRVAFKSSHNAYHKKLDLVQQLRFDERRPHRGGCRGLELDLAAREDALEWSVEHTSKFLTHADHHFSRYLAELQKWSEECPDHDVITVTLDLKHVPRKVDDWPDLLDKYIAGHLDPDRIFKPADLRAGEKDLRAGAEAGWPKLGRLTGKFVLCLSGLEWAKAGYAAEKDQLCFADLEVGPGDPAPGDALRDRVFLNVPMTHWMRDLKGLVKLIRSGSWMVRTFFTTEEIRWAVALAAGANILATDNIRGPKWSKVGDGPFRALPPRELAGEGLLG